MKTLIKVSAFFTLFFFSFNLNGKTPVNTGLHFDFYQNADRATWKTTTHGTSDDYTLRFGIDHRHLGSARRVKKTMEDGKVRHVLHTHPRWTSNGVIRGYYPFINKIPAQSRFTGFIGFIKPNGSPKTDGARFFIYVKYYDSSSRRYKNVKIYEYYKRYDGRLRAVNIDLSRFAGKKASFELRVDTGSKPTEDWAAWYNAKVTSKGAAVTPPPSRLSPINKAVNAAILGPTTKDKKIFGHTFNFERSVTITVDAKTGDKYVHGYFDHHKSLQQDDVYYFTVVFDRNNNYKSSNYRIDGGNLLPESRIRTKRKPFRRTKNGLSSATVDRLANEARIRLAGRNNWVRTAGEISKIIAKTAVSYQ